MSDWVEIHPTPPCRHIWELMKIEEKVVDPRATLRRYTHRCPRCGREKITVRRVNGRDE